MNKEEFKKRFESLSDLKVIRFQLGFISGIIPSFIFFYLSIIFGFNAIINLIHGNILDMIVAFILHAIFGLLLYQVTEEDKKKREEFLIKYGKNN